MLYKKCMCNAVCIYMCMHPCAIFVTLYTCIFLLYDCLYITIHIAYTNLNLIYIHSYIQVPIHFFSRR